MRAKSIKGSTVQEINSELTECLVDGFQPTFAIIFCSVKQEIRQIIELFDERQISVFGSTSNGEFINSDFTEGACAVLLLDINQRFFKSFSMYSNRLRNMRLPAQLH